MELPLTQHSILRISDKKTLQLVDLYEKEQCLWNTSLEEYKSRAKRNEAAVRIAKKLKLQNFSARYVIIKFKNLRNSYCQELKKVANSVAAGDEPPYRPKVFWFTKMDSFLRPHLHQSRECTSRHEQEIIIKSEPSEQFNQFSNPDEVLVDENNDYDDSTDSDDENQPLNKRSRSSSITSKNARVEELPSSASKELVRLTRDISAHLQVMTNQKDDCYDSFGKYVAAMLRTMPVRKAMELQPQIVNLLVFGTSGNNEQLISQSHEETDYKNLML